MNTGTAHLPIAEIQYDVNSELVEPACILPYKLLIPIEYIEAVEEFLRNHGYLTHEQRTEFSMKGHTYLTIYGAWL